MISYRTIRRTYQPRSWAGDVVVDQYAQLISPVLTSIFVRAKIAPNTVTILMMVSGVAAQYFLRCQRLD